MLNKNLFVLFLLTACNNTWATKTIISGHFNYEHDSVISVQYSLSPVDFIESIETQIEANVDISGNFKVCFDIYKPVRINVHNGDKWVFINKFINPGDSLWFDLYTDKMEIDGIGENGLSAQFTFENKFLTGYALSQFQNSAREMKPIEFGQFWTDRLDSELALFDSYYAKDTVPMALKKAVKYEMIYEERTAIVQYAMKNNTRNVFSEPGYMSYLSGITQNDSDALVTDNYVFFLRELPFNLWMCKNDQKHFDSATVKYNENNQIRLRDSIAGIYFSGLSYDVALYSILYEAIKSLSYYNGTAKFEANYLHADSILNELGNGFNDKTYLGRLYRKLAAFKEEDKPAPDFTAHTLDGKEVKLSDYKGKVVYVDFWATSCVPCVAELPYILKLQEKYRNKDLIFLYFSLDHSKEILNRFIYERGFTGTHLIDQKGFSSDAAMKYNISGIPRYILVDRKGLLISSDAPRPSSHPEEMIDKALEEK